MIGLSVVLFFLGLAIVGPWLTDATPFEFGYPLGEPPSREYWLGTTSAGQDVFAQFVYGLRSSFFVGALGGCVAALIAMTVGFVGGYRGGFVDDLLSMLTNVVLVIPTLAVLIVVAAYLSVQSLAVEALLIGVPPGRGRRARSGRRRSRSPHGSSSVSPGFPARAVRASSSRRSRRT